MNWSLTLGTKVWITRTQSISAVVSNIFPSTNASTKITSQVASMFICSTVDFIIGAEWQALWSLSPSWFLANTWMEIPCGTAFSILGSGNWVVTIVEFLA